MKNLNIDCLDQIWTFQSDEVCVLITLMSTHTSFKILRCLIVVKVSFENMLWLFEECIKKIAKKVKNLNLNFFPFVDWDGQGIFKWGFGFWCSAFINRLSLCGIWREWLCSLPWKFDWLLIIVFDLSEHRLVGKGKINSFCFFSS